MHSAIAQQNLFNELPSILEKFKTSSETVINIKSPDSNFSLHLNLKHIQQMLDLKFEALKVVLKDYETEQLCLTPQSGLLKLLCPALRELKEETNIKNVRLIKEIDGGSLLYTTDAADE